ncbi:hypothetical protein [Sphingomonas corticis]|jgi:hypothetical protein|uniref:Uncharacterized protein n=1 Tax=Sphingomonas corticis TaxID=2722791 RepID=A0ABX1CM74_9SPHN|nr:hypothetical protein [Sphingomonas corticis]NJR79039.1 hypothetical protein [Sphingomonas corticis]
MSSANDHEAEVVSAARQEAQRMIASVETAGEDRTVTMRVDQFRRLAHLLGGVAAAADRDGRFDAPIDGVRFWVPLQHLATERARFAQMLASRPAMNGADRFAF